jgi:hypothetical protein
MVWFARRSKVIIEAWRRHYNEVRPHSSLGWRTPNEFVARQRNATTCHVTSLGTAVCGPPFLCDATHYTLRKCLISLGCDGVTSSVQ